MKMNKEVVMVRVSDIIPNRFQPRLTFDEEALNELANSIKEHGIIQPLILRDLGSKYEIIAGERRYKASQLAGLTEVPAIVGSMDDQTSAELALIENIQRKDLTAIEEAKSYKIILDMGRFTQEELAKRMGKSQSTIANKMRLLSLTNEVQVALMNNLISERHARCLLQIRDEEKQKEILNKIITERMNVRDTDDYIKNMLGISKPELPGLEKEIVAVAPINYDAPRVELFDIRKSEAQSTMNEFNLPKVEIPEIPVNEPIELPKVDTPEVVPVEMPKIDFSQTEKNKEERQENPNVYSAFTANDFIDISHLNNEDVTTSPVKTALDGLNIVSTESNIFGGSNLSVEEKEVDNMLDIEQPVTNSQNNDLFKIKLATAIKLAKDSADEIKKAGYNVVLEELDGRNEYQIIIKVEK